MKGRPVLPLLALTAALLVAGVLGVLDLWQEYRAPRLPKLGPGFAHRVPRVSVLVPARNEAARIGPLLEGLARQRYPALDVVVLDDHSTDGTGALARGYAGRVAGLRVLEGAALPEGWAGKCWACQQAADKSRGDWLLFLDADVAPLPGLVERLVAHAEKRKLDLLSLMPRLVVGSLAERLVLPAFMSLLYALYPLTRVSNPRSRLAFANGQVMLVRRSVYQALGGHTSVKDSLLEDTHLGQKVKRAGYALEVARGYDAIDIRMYTDWRSVAEGLGKNAVAGFRSGGARSGLVGVRQAWVAFVPLLAPLLWPTLAAAHAPSWLALPGLAGAAVAVASWCHLARRRYLLSPAWGLLFPVGLAVYFGLAGRALWRLTRGHGVTWKGRRLGAAPP